MGTQKLARRPSVNILEQLPFLLTKQAIQKEHQVFILSFFEVIF